MKVETMAFIKKFKSKNYKLGNNKKKYSWDHLQKMNKKLLTELLKITKKISKLKWNFLLNNGVKIRWLVPLQSPKLSMVRIENWFTLKNK